MQRIFYALCPLPVTFLFLSWLLPADSHATPAAARHPFDWLALAILSGPALSFYGLVLIVVKLNEEEDVRGLAIATAISALPVLYYLYRDVVPR